MPAFDLVVIGGGTAGLTAARLVAHAGRRVALIEADRPGGDCLWTGCVPSKALVEAARVARTVASAGRFGVRAEVLGVDFAAVMRHIRASQAVAGEVDGVDAIRAHGIEYIQGFARFLDPHTAVVDGRRVTGRFFLVATGTRPAAPPIPGLAAAGVDTTDSVWSWETLPGRLAVIGAGAAGCELAQAFRRLGSDVVLLERGDRVLAGEAPAASEVIRGVLEADGVRVVTGADVQGVHAAGGVHEVVWESPDGRTSERADRVIVTAGRAPRTDGLGLEAAGVVHGPTGIVVDSRLRTTARHIYAAGDITGGPQYTHVAEDQGRAVANAIVGGLMGRLRWNGRVVPRVTFTDPEVAAVGLTAEEARSKFGRRARTWRLPLQAVDRAVAAGAGDGFLEVTTVRGRERFIPFLGSALGGQIVGATFVAPAAGDLLGTIVVGMRLRVPAALLVLNVQPYPTYGLGVRQVLGLAFDPTTGARPGGLSEATADARVEG